ncbi:MAG TPA: class I SAM-dependent methyltransferase [Polyangiaceae bacterium]
MQGEPSAAVTSASRRFRTGSDADVDAYLLEDGRFFLFCHLLDGSLAADDAYARSLVGAFPEGTVMGVGRALKTDEGSTPLAPVWFGEAPAGGELWTVEAGVRFRLEAERVLNPGLFLDQRENRQRLGELVREARIEPGQREDDGLLNLFSYTGAFSLAARRAGVRRTTSVDLSARYLAWERQNFDANFAGAAATPSEEAPRLIRDDARAFLRRAVKKGAKYRFIVIDPPTFSRGQKDVFRVQEQLVPMARDALECLCTDGLSAVLVSMNDARWNPVDFFGAFDGLARDAGVRAERGHTPADFGDAHPLKSVWLIRG